MKLLENLVMVFQKMIEIFWLKELNFRSKSNSKQKWFYNNLVGKFILDLKMKQENRNYILEQGKKLGMILVATPGLDVEELAGLYLLDKIFKKTNPFSVGLGRFINFDKILLEKKHLCHQKKNVRLGNSCYVWDCN